MIMITGACRNDEKAPRSLHGKWICQQGFYQGMIIEFKNDGAFILFSPAIAQLNGFEPEEMLVNQFITNHNMIIATINYPIINSFGDKIDVYKKTVELKLTPNTLTIASAKADNRENQLWLRYE